MSTNKLTRQFFYNDCRPLFISIIRRVYGMQVVDYDEIINEIYILLMENDARRLREFDFRSTLFNWQRTVAVRYCLKLKAGNKVVCNKTKEPLDDKRIIIPLVENTQAKMDLNNLLSLMKNQRYALIIRLLMIDCLSPEDVARKLSVRIDNLYSIKRRAMRALMEVALKDKKHYG